MKKEALDYWERAVKAYETASALSADDPDASASRSYYAAFYAVSALFSLQEKSFRRHSALEAAVHRDLVNTGRWSKDMGADYSWLVRLRYTGDYGGEEHVTFEDANEAAGKALRILKTVSETSSGTFDIEKEPKIKT